MNDNKEKVEGLSGHKRPRSDLSTSFQIPVLNSDCLQRDNNSIQDAYQKCQALFIPKVATNSNSTFSWKELSSLFESLDKDKESWCIENGGDANVLPPDFLHAKQVGYSSFLLQKDTTILQDTLIRLPVCEISKSWSHSKCIWWFFGVSDGKAELEGRPEHTDSVSHDGTWHYQLSGSKRWYLRPSEELLQTCPEATATVIDCKEGDVLIVNTRLWWHQTKIPTQTTPSVSYARDFYLEGNTKEKGDIQEPSSMTNVDGMYAPRDLEEGAIVFTEEDMPDCELPHSETNFNCRVVELEDGTSALISTRPIKSGEFFCVADDENDESEQDGEESFDEDVDSDGELCLPA